MCSGLVLGSSTALTVVIIELPTFLLHEGGMIPLAA